MLGSVSEADDAVQQSWIRLSRSDPEGIENLAGWLTTVVARVCLDILRARRSRREELGPQLPEPIVDADDESDPEHEALLADSIGLALLVVLETLTPAERLAFVLHDMFAVPFEEIAPVVGRTPAAARKLASRARRRVQAAPIPDPDLVLQRRVADAFQAAAREGDFEALVAVLDPEVVLHVDRGALRPGVPREVRGAEAVAAQARLFAHRARHARPALVNGGAGFVVFEGGEPVVVTGFTIADGKIVEIDILADPERLRALDLKVD
jgi:RNA polymerase sigma factor (sigma-70 family)